VQGVLEIRREVSPGAIGQTILVPLRYAFAGRVTVPEATARVARDDAPLARAPARTFTIR
jgi:hypothetical protein